MKSIDRVDRVDVYQGCGAVDVGRCVLVAREKAQLGGGLTGFNFLKKAENEDYFKWKNVFCG